MSNTDYIYLADHGKCAQEQVDTNVFFPEAKPGSRTLQALEAEAKLVCNGCPVVNLCLQVALENKEQGVWGGTTDLERARMRSRRGRYRSIQL